MASIPTKIRSDTKARVWATGMVGFALLLISWAAILSGNLSGRGASDDLLYHWPAIERFAQQIPAPDISDYASATTPGYHLLLAPIVRLGADHTVVQLIASAWSLGLLALLTWVVAGRFGKGAAVLMLPMVASMYVLYPGIWLLPDNAGWLGVLVILLLSLKPEPTWKTWMISGVVLFGLIWMRQIHIWIAGVIWLSAWLGSTDQTPEIRTLFSAVFDRGGRAFIALACTIPAIAALVWFIAVWGGLVPPTFQDNHQGPNRSTPGFILTQLAILSVFFAPMLWDRLKEVWKHQSGWIIFAIVIGCALGVFPASSYSYDAGRYSGWWNLINKLPVIADRSPIILIGSISGSIALVVWLNLVTRRDAWIWIGAFVAFVLAQSANHASWQRYHEPMLLITILLIFARSTALERYERSLMLGSVALAMMLGSLTISSMLSAKPIETQDQSSILP
jgi:hypothetical protein